MTYAPEQLKAARTFIINNLGVAANAVGIVGDDTHQASGSSYHLGRSSLRSDSYTITESSRDRNGLSEAASGLDIGEFVKTISGKRHTLRTFSVWLVAQCKAGAADTRDIREVIYSPDGQTVRRWDRLGIRSTGDSSHLWHTHISYFRDSESRDKTGLFRRYLASITEDDVTPEDIAATAAATWNRELPNGLSAQNHMATLLVRSDSTENRRLPAVQADLASIKASLANVQAQLVVLAGKDEVDEQAIVTGVLAGLDPAAIAAAVAAALPADQAKKVADELAARLTS